MGIYKKNLYIDGIDASLDQDFDKDIIVYAHKLDWVKCTENQIQMYNADILLAADVVRRNFTFDN